MKSFWNTSPRKSKKKKSSTLGLFGLGSKSPRTKPKRKSLFATPNKENVRTLLNQFKEISSKKDSNLNWAEAKRKYPNLKPNADTDRDGVSNRFDCRPLNRNRQDLIYGWQNPVEGKIIPAEKGRSVRYGGRGTGHSGTGVYGYASKEKAMKDKHVYAGEDRSLYAIEIKKPFKPGNASTQKNEYYRGGRPVDFHDTLRSIKNEELTEKKVKEIIGELETYGIKKTAADIKRARKVSDEKEINPANIILGEEGYDGVIYEDKIMDSHYGGSVKFQEEDLDEKKLIKVDEDMARVERQESDKSDDIDAGLEALENDDDDEIELEDLSNEEDDLE